MTIKDLMAWNKIDADICFYPFLFCSIFITGLATGWFIYSCKICFGEYASCPVCLIPCFYLHPYTLPPCLFVYSISDYLIEVCNLKITASVQSGFNMHTLVVFILFYILLIEEYGYLWTKYFSYITAEWHVVTGFSSAWRRVLLFSVIRYNFITFSLRHFGGIYNLIVWSFDMGIIAHSWSLFICRNFHLIWGVALWSGLVMFPNSERISFHRYFLLVLLQLLIDTLSVYLAHTILMSFQKVVSPELGVHLML